MMSEENLLKRFLRWLGLKNPASVESHPGEYARMEMLHMVAQMVAETEDVELTCDEVYVLLDVCAELAQQGGNVTEKLPLVERHLDMCPDCREEYEALLRILDTPQEDVVSQDV